MTDENRTPRYSIGELAQATGVPRRTIRYYVQLGLLLPPKGAGRGHYYEQGHYERLVRIRELRDRGFSLDRVGAASSGREDDAPVPEVEMLTRIQLADGIHLTVGGGRRPPNARQIRELTEAVARIFDATDAP